MLKDPQCSRTTLACCVGSTKKLEVIGLETGEVNVGRGLDDGQGGTAERDVDVAAVACAKLLTRDDGLAVIRVANKHTAKNQRRSRQEGGVKAVQRKARRICWNPHDTTTVGWVGTMRALILKDHRRQRERNLFSKQSFWDW